MKFRKETNLDAVKQMASTFIYADFDVSNPLAPAIVQHPFTNSAFVSIPGYKDNIVNILDDEDGLAMWQEFIKKRIRQAGSAESIMTLVSKNYRICLFDYILPYLSVEDMSYLLASIWTNLETVNDNGVMTQRKLLGLFKQAVPEYLMDSKEREALRGLPETVTVYRGFTEERNPNFTKALSWTTNRKTARWFALRFSRTGRVAKATIPKEHIHAFFAPGNEDEVIVDSKFLDIIEVKNVRRWN